MNIFSNPVYLVIGGFFIFLVPRAFRLIAGLSLVAVGLTGLLAQSDSFVELE
jgi:hypothetical protein